MLHAARMHDHLHERDCAAVLHHIGVASCCELWHRSKEILSVQVVGESLHRNPEGEEIRIGRRHGIVSRSG